MSTKLAKSVVSKALAFSLLVGVCVGGAAMPASATPAGPEAAATSADVEASWVFDGNVMFHYGYGGIDLGAGKKIDDAAAKYFDLLEDADHKPLGINVGISQGYFYGNFSVRAAYPLLLVGQPTEFWLQTGVRYDTGMFGKGMHGTCEVFRGEPGTPGAEAVWDSPFQCETDRQPDSFDGPAVWDFAIRPAGGATASGTIAPVQGLALTDGTFRTDLQYHTVGASEVAVGQSTNFFVVLTGKDDPFYENQARMEFAYQMVDNGRETGMWVAGLATNFRGKLGFSADGRCAIYKNNPLIGKGRLDFQRPINDTDFRCSAKGTSIHGPGEDDDRHFDAAFLVGWR